MSTIYHHVPSWTQFKMLQGPLFVKRYRFAGRYYHTNFRCPELNEPHVPSQKFTLLSGWNC